MASNPILRSDFDSLWDYDHPDSTEQRFRGLRRDEPERLERLRRLGDLPEPAPKEP